MKKKVLGIILVLVMMISIMPIGAINVMAGTSEWSNVKFYAAKSINVYKNSSTKTVSGTIDKGDLVTISRYDSSSDKFIVTYPITRGNNKGATGTGYIKRSDVCSKLKDTPSWKVAEGFSIRAYTDKTCKKATTIPEGSKVVVIDSSNTDMLQVITKNYLLWIKKEDVRKAPKISELKTYRIASKLNTNYVLDVSGGKKTADTNIQLYKWNKTSAQVFKFDGPDKYGYYRIINVNSNLYVGAPIGNNIVQTTAGDNWFHIAEDNSGYVIFKIIFNDKNLDVAGAKVGNGTNIQLYLDNGSDAQRFKLIEVSVKL